MEIYSSSFLLANRFYFLPVVLFIIIIMFTFYITTIGTSCQLVVWTPQYQLEWAQSSF